MNGKIMALRGITCEGKVITSGICNILGLSGSRRAISAGRQRYWLPRL
jgi:hypothetical protein